ncbi:non-structural maintenance of chromosomes element 4 homolog A [Tanacetum coccineum]
MVRNNEKGESSKRRFDLNEEAEAEDGDDQNDCGFERRVLRSRYLAVKNLISVQKPREQVADAEALLDITNTLVTSVKAQSNEGVTAGDFVSSLLKGFGRLGGGNDGTDGSRNAVKWKNLGIVVSHVFVKGDGCCTMLGPMNSKVKHRKVTVHRKHSRLTEKARPEELASSLTEEKTDTDKNMATMFNVLRNNRAAKLERLVLNRSSFAQTVENLFALSFLVKDGRAEIKVDEKGCHRVCTNIVKDRAPTISEYNVDHASTLIAQASLFLRFPEKFLCWVGISRNYLLNKDTYPRFEYEDGEGGCSSSYTR